MRRHPVVVDNRYTRWFATGEATADEVRHLTVQFSVFSHLFVEAQLRKVINAADLDTYRAGKEILMNELGVIFSRLSTAPRPTTASIPSWSRPKGRSTAAASASRPPTSSGWCASPRPLGLGFDQTRANAATPPPSTLLFCDELLRIYGSEDPSIAEGASYAVEHWAAAGFWKELIAGLTAFRSGSAPSSTWPFGPGTTRSRTSTPPIPTTSWPRRCALPGFDEEKFLAGAERDARRGTGVLGRTMGRPTGREVNDMKRR